MDDEQNLNNQYLNNQNNQNGQNNQLNKKESNNRKTIIILVVIITILSATLVGGYIYFQSKNNVDNNANNIDNNNNDNIVETGTYQVLNWNNSIAYNPSKSFYKEPSEDSEYTNVATLKTGETVVRVAEWWSEDYFLVDSNNNITFLAKYSTSDEDYLVSGIKIDNESTIPEIFPESDITYKEQILEFTYHGLEDGEHAPDESKGTKLQSTDYGDLYEYKFFVSDDLYVRRFYVKTPDKKATHYYELKNIDIYNDDRTLKVNWDDNANKTITWEMPMSSCGNNGSRLHIKGYTTSMGTKIGITTTNKPLYRLTDDKLLKLLYDEYYYDSGEDDGWNHNLGFTEFKTKLTSVVYQDDLGEWIVLQNDKYSHAAECGKPVIYLYPEKDTYVNVEVGANVSISDPLYISGGWKNVLARPNGILTYQGKEYDSLFWEGIGFGTYPNVNKVGRVVTQDNLISTIKKDLKDQGLTQKEIADFIEFWKDYLPNAPYVKLTWLTTEQMKTLAPLKVNPKPDTVIRVFLDAKGLEKPIKLTPQKLTKIERKGFTLVEWGGLLKK